VTLPFPSLPCPTLSYPASNSENACIHRLSEGGRGQREGNRIGRSSTADLCLTDCCGPGDGASDPDKSQCTVSGLPNGDWLAVLPEEGQVLRDYQRRQVEDIHEALVAGNRRLLVQLPTGGGKTHVIGLVVLAAKNGGLRCLVLATRSRLVRQLHDRLEDFGVPHGVIASPLPELRNISAPVQIASVDTLHRRAMVNRHIPLPGADVVIFDEGHLATAKTRLGILDAYPDAVRIGFTATPARKSGRSLGAAFDSLILGPSIRELTQAGTLVRARVFNTPVVTTEELKALPKDTDNDYRTAALGSLLSRPKLIGDVVDNWLRIADGKRSLVFAVNKNHASALAQQFRQAGIAAEMLVDTDDEETREQVIARLEAGDTRVVVNCFLMSYGVDIPTVECIVLARPTRSLVMYLQMLGRGLRPAPGKDSCFIIDHGHVVECLGLPSSDFGWTLDPDCNVNTQALTAARKETAEAMRTCRECSSVWLTSEQGNACPECGWTPVPKAKPVIVQQADLEELVEEAEPTCATDPRVLRFFQEAIGWNQEHKPHKWLETPNKVRAACWHAAREKFRLPDTRIPSVFWTVPAIPASLAVSGYLRYRNIKFAKSARSRAA